MLTQLDRGNPARDHRVQALTVTDRKCRFFTGSSCRFGEISISINSSHSLESYDAGLVAPCPLVEGCLEDTFWCFLSKPARTAPTVRVAMHTAQALNATHRGSSCHLGSTRYYHCRVRRLLVRLFFRSR